MDEPTSNGDPIEIGGAEPSPWPGEIPFARPVCVETTLVPPAGDTWPPTMSRLRALIELLILIPAAILGLVAVAVPLIIIKPADTRWYNVFSSVGMGCGALSACIVMMLISRQKPASIGWTSRNLGINVGLGVAAMIATYAGRLVILVPLSLIFPQILDQAETAQNAIEEAFPPMTFLWIVLMMTFVVTWEEVVFRGFLLTRLQVVFRRWWLTVTTGSLVFGVIHGYQGILAMALITGLALVMSLLFVWRRSLVPSMVVHWMNNVGVVLVLEALSSTWR